MTLDQLNYVMSIAESGSISKASEKLYMTHAAPSVSLTNLEKELGVAIFIRSSKGVRPTVQGEKVIASIRRIQLEIELIRKTTSNVEIRDDIKVATIATISNNILLDAIVSFNKRYPNCNVLINEIYPSEVLHQVIENKAAIGISFIETAKFASFEKFAKQKNIGWVPVYHDYLCVYVNKNSPLASRKSVSEDDLKNTLSISINHRHVQETRSYYDNFLDSSYHFAFTNQESIKKMIAENDLVTYLPKVLAYGDYYVKSGAIVPLDVTDNKQELIHCIFFRLDHTFNDSEKYLITLIQETYDTIKNHLANMDV